MCRTICARKVCFFRICVYNSTRVYRRRQSRMVVVARPASHRGTLRCAIQQIFAMWRRRRTARAMSMRCALWRRRVVWHFVCLRVCALNGFWPHSARERFEKENMRQRHKHTHTLSKKTEAIRKYVLTYTRTNSPTTSTTTR